MEYVVAVLAAVVVLGVIYKLLSRKEVKNGPGPKNLPNPRDNNDPPRAED